MELQTEERKPLIGSGAYIKGEGAAQTPSATAARCGFYINGKGTESKQESDGNISDQSQS